MFFFFCLLLFIVLNGRVTAEIVLIGIAVAAAVTALAHRLAGWKKEEECFLIRNIPLLFLYALVLIREIIMAAFAVMQVAFSRRAHPEPVLVEFRSGFPSEIQNVLLANSITLTPGTYTLRKDGDHFVVHCLRREYADGMDSSVFVRNLRKMH